MKKISELRLVVSRGHVFLAIAVLFAAGLFLSTTFAADPDFSGTWTLNNEKSEIGEGRFRPSAILEVKQDKTNLAVVRIRTGRDGEERRRETVYSLDGKETTSGGENRSTKSTAKWSEEGTSIIINSKSSWTREGETFEFESVETWMLGEDGKILSIQSTVSSSRGKSSAKLVYDRAP